jgi:hypothetical protein
MTSGRLDGIAGGSDVSMRFDGDTVRVQMSTIWGGIRALWGLRRAVRRAVRGGLVGHGLRMPLNVVLQLGWLPSVVVARRGGAI